MNSKEKAGRKINYRYLDTVEKLKTGIRGLNIESEVCVDLETEGPGQYGALDPFNNKIVLLQIGNKHVQLLIPWYTLEEGLSYVKKFLEDRLWVAHNLQFEYLNLAWHYGIRPKSGLCDTMIDEQTITQGASTISRNLENTVKRRTGVAMSSDQGIGKTFSRSHISEQQLKYAAEDLLYLQDVKEVQSYYIEQLNIEFKMGLEHRLLPVLAEACLEGVYLDTEAWERNIDANIEKKFQLECEMDDIIKDLARNEGYEQILGGKFTRDRRRAQHEQTSLIPGTEKKYTNQNKGNINYGSSQQVLDIFRRVGEKTPKKGDGSPSLQEEFLYTWIIRNPNSPLKPFAVKYQEFIKIKKELDSFGENYLKLIKPDGKLHTIYRQQFTVTGRLSSGDNKAGLFQSQQLPRLSKFRNCFHAGEGYSLLGSDLSGAELNILACMAQDDRLKELNAGDNHSYFATKCFQELAQNIKESDKNQTFINILKSSDVTNVSQSTIDWLYKGLLNKSIEFYKDGDILENIRTNFKRVSFGIAYGCTGKRVGEIFGISQDYGNIMLDVMRKEIPKSFEFLDSVAERALKQGYIVFNNRTNSRRWFEDVIDAKKRRGRLSGKIKSQVERYAKNSIIQGSQSDMIKEIMVEVDKFIKDNGFDAKILLSIHDEIHIKVRDNQAEKLKPEFERIMQTIPELYIGSKIKSEAEISKVWKK